MTELLPNTDTLLTGIKSEIMVNPSAVLVQKMLLQSDQESQNSTGKMGLLRFVASRSGDVSFGDASLYWHVDLMKKIKHNDDCLLGFIRANGIFYLRSGTISLYTGIQNSTVVDLKNTHFFKTYEYLMKGLKFAGDDEHTD